LAQVRVLSAQLLEAPRTSKPLADAVFGQILSLAEVTVPLRPVTLNLRYVLTAGDPCAAILNVP
jgi:hypothetical protein